ncbi:MAG TPA: hypothetical protein VNQ52_08230 [Microbacteriaceae bacterium]|nr:hypothetical protein [Microbacteriaceae bacterium]
MTIEATARVLELTELEPGRWRLCDPARPLGDIEHLVAYIEDQAGSFETVWLRGAFGCARFGSLDEAIAAAHAR